MRKRKFWGFFQQQPGQQNEQDHHTGCYTHVKNGEKKINYRKVGIAGLAIGLAGAALIVLAKKKKK